MVRSLRPRCSVRQADGLMFASDRTQSHFRELRLGIGLRVTFAVPGGPGARVFRCPKTSSHASWPGSSVRTPLTGWRQPRRLLPMRRRNFITLLGGAAAAWPLAAHAQQMMPIVGFLHQGQAKQAESFAAAFREGLNKSGYIEGQNVTIEYRWAEGDYDRLRQMAADLVHRKVSVIASVFSVACLAAKAATSTIPIVFATGTDPIREGLVPALNRPGGNVTGVTFFVALLGAKRLSLLHDVLPAAKTIALLINPTNHVVSENYLKDTQTAARTLGLQIIVVPASSEHEIDNGFHTMAEQRIDALMISPDAFLLSRQDQIVALAARHAIPTMYLQRRNVVAGGLMSYSGDLAGAHRELGIYTGRILKGEKPADIPVAQSTKFEFVLNLKTAKTLGLTIPPDVLSIADEAIE
jgi:putative ABC transport system substrate-binding protein